MNKIIRCMATIENTVLYTQPAMLLHHFHLQPSSSVSNTLGKVEQWWSSHCVAASVRHATIVRHATRVRHATSVRHATRVRHTASVRHATSVRHTASVRHATRVRHATSVRYTASVRHATRVRHPTRVRHATRLSCLVWTIRLVHTCNVNILVSSKIYQLILWPCSWLNGFAGKEKKA